MSAHALFKPATRVPPDSPPPSLPPSPPLEATAGKVATAEARTRRSSKERMLDMGRAVGRALAVPKDAEPAFTD